MKKRVITVALVLCMVAIIGFGSLAYFQTGKDLTNYFAVAGIIDPEDPDEIIDPNDLFSIRLDEINMNTQTGFGDRTEEGNTYTGILPGDTLTKDPTVTNTGKYDAWVRVKVEVSDFAAWKAACEKHGITDLAAIFNGHDAKAWSRGQADEVLDTENDTYTFVYYYNDKVAPGGKVTLFQSVTIPAEFDIDDMVSLATFQFKITGEAIQVANTGNNAKDAFRNFWGK